jgi:hypothetical protein
VLRTKVAVGRVINTINLSTISPKTWSRITHGALSWKQDFSNEDKCHRYRVDYPNGYGVSIIGYPNFTGRSTIWRVVLFQDGKLCVEDDGTFYIRHPRSEGEVFDICDIVSRA